ncbi:MAG TPA: ATP--guanido phosphotransferase, partial [Bacillota bacterium]|nr:ATP--guanido phosphotransferase [Bacillota bacterium]
EEWILSDLGQLVREVADEERRSRRRLLEKGRLLIEDEIGRAKGQLMGARLMSTEEAMRLLSLVRLGRELEIPGMPDYPTIQRLFVGIGAGVIQQTAGRPLDPGRRDEERATLIREALHSSE